MTKTPKDVNKYSENAKLKKGELLEILRIKLIGCQIEGDEPCGGCELKKSCLLPQAYQQIKEMIQKPKVTEGFIEKWEKKFPTCVRADIIWNRRYIKEMLKEAGVGVSG